MKKEDIQIFFDKLIIYFRNLIAYAFISFFALGILFIGQSLFLLVFIELPIDYLFDISVFNYLISLSKDLFGIPYLILIPLYLFNAKAMLSFLTDDTKDAMYNPFSLEGNNSYWKEKEKDKRK